MKNEGKKEEVAARDGVIRTACRMLCTACIGRPEGCGADPLVCLKASGLSGLLALELAEMKAGGGEGNGNTAKEEEL